jgi:hypothetical protein
VLLYRTFVAFALPLARVSIVVGIHPLYLSRPPQTYHLTTMADSPFAARSPLTVVYLLHVALEMPVAIQGMLLPYQLPFLEMNNTALVLLKACSFCTWHVTRPLIDRFIALALSSHDLLRSLRSLALRRAALG